VGSWLAKLPCRVECVSPKPKPVKVDDMTARSFGLAEIAVGVEDSLIEQTSYSLNGNLKQRIKVSC